MIRVCVCRGGAPQLHPAVPSRTELWAGSAAARCSRGVPPRCLPAAHDSAERSSSGAGIGFPRPQPGRRAPATPSRLPSGRESGRNPVRPV